MTPNEWKDLTINKTYNVDGAYGAQCWDFLAYFFQYFKIPASTYCALTGYVCDLWRLKERYGYSKFFDFITDAKDLKPGDWCFWDRGSSHSNSHVAMYMFRNGTPVELGQNQGFPYVTEKTTSWDIMGALRFKGWGALKYGASDVEISGRKYAMYRQHAGQKAVILSAGIDKLAKIQKLDANVNVYAKITGANFFQARTDTEQPYGMCFGDVSAPLNDVWRELPNQDTTLYFDLETGLYGDCTGVHIKKTHNVYSPAVVFPESGHYQYARMVGINHVNNVSRYTFAIRFKNGTYAVGLAQQDSTPNQITEDFKSLCTGELESIAFLDGGDSAQMGRWKDGAFEYVRDTKRACPSAFAIVSELPIHETESDPPQDTENSPETNETGKNEEQNMSEENTQEAPVLEPVKVDGWTDPEPMAETTTETIIKRFMSVKSFVTLSLTGVFAYLSIKGTISPEQFMSVFTMCISFFFGYSFEKKNNQK